MRPYSIYFWCKLIVVAHNKVEAVALFDGSNLVPEHKCYPSMCLDLDTMSCVEYTRHESNLIRNHVEKLILDQGKTLPMFIGTLSDVLEYQYPDNEPDYET